MSDVSTSERLQLDILQTLGTLQQQVGVLQAQCAHIIKSQDEADVRRRDMYGKLNRIDGIQADLNRITPLVEAHERKHQRNIGAVWLMRALWTIGGGAAGATMVSWISKLFGAPPPHP
ncbi:MULTISPECIES: hypothetical protein [Rhodopseudomonas]|uniref:DUF1515 domain-containing protein n=1 Tax=Rhodopseudomonas palustris TaxID=1076 RepID=A0A0D7F2U1_RHOPL|nr:MULTISPECIES: hypothetical protein [Rhodopseudomonas]KIZ47403.1 hypothetical protein OO17_04665 [Rhodopseudomonas palustris]MDF3809251.1 hypothetical protein [Rhodopseudomonas sp. BAL398]WOK19064.1 hypothetical protein RBJ75_05970 [Rhodopseudomonas sp. BAL398]